MLSGIKQPAYSQSPQVQMQANLNVNQPASQVQAAAINRNPSQNAGLFSNNNETIIEETNEADESVI